ncbi:MAG: peptidase M20, partial [Actinomycetota bacterium]|nr:peptidase M20 [Actinomycetota bacterium]
MSPLTPAEATVAMAVDGEEILRDLRDLVAIASVGGSPGEADVQRWGASRLTELGLSVDCWDIDVAAEQRQPGFPGMEVERTTALGCVGLLGDPSGTPALALYGHTDVVPPGSLD